MMRERFGDGLPSRAEVEDMIAEQARVEEDAVRRGELTVFELCARWFLPGLTERPLADGRTLGRVEWARFPRRRRSR